MNYQMVRRMQACLAFLPFALMGVVAGAPAHAKPNFSGDWKLNSAKSDFGPLPAPTTRTDKITHSDPTLKVSISASGQQGEMNYEMEYNTEGKETTNDLRGNPAKTTGKWDGDALLLDTKASFGGNDLELMDKWTLSEDGKTLTINRHIKAPQGELEQTIVLEKQ